MKSRKKYGWAVTQPNGHRTGCNCPSCFKAYEAALKELKEIKEKKKLP